MLRVKLKKLYTSTENHKLRTEEAEGKCTHIPQPGYCFVMFGEALSQEFKDLAVATGAEAVRMIRTSEVKDAQYNYDTHQFTFHTENSTYELTLLDNNVNPFEFTHVRGKES